MVDGQVSAIAALPAGYHELFDRIVMVLRNQEQVAALWLSGSIGRGVADAGSDLDLIITLRGPADDWLVKADALLAVLEPIITVPISSKIWAVTTRGGLRVDLVVESEADLDTTPFRYRVAVFGPACLIDRIPPADEKAASPDRDKVRKIITEFFRQQVIFPAAVVARQDWLLGQEGVHNTRLMLYQLFVELNQPLPPMGVKQWSAKLTADQRAVLVELVPPAAEHKAVIGAMHAVRSAFLTAAHAATDALGVDWPHQQDDVVAGYWRANGLDPEGRQV